ncbi:hypothetical protein [Vulgatibacter incomptus]|uniref:hypothetical protein n=1 Tax=Vulgatibacter incomptus TaxID=1391653 RepID=UPI000AE9B13D|nr:hypothetical protein [Vulgatibacter incomptus]
MRIRGWMAALGACLLAGCGSAMDPGQGNDGGSGGEGGTGGEIGEGGSGGGDAGSGGDAGGGAGGGDPGDGPVPIRASLGDIRWGETPCPADMRCATVDVPLDWSDEASERISLFLRSLPAKGERKGRIWLLAGGQARRRRVSSSRRSRRPSRRRAWTCIPSTTAGWADRRPWVAASRPTT